MRNERVTEMKRIIALGIILSFFLMSVHVSADSFDPPEPSKIELEDGAKVFYMTPLRYAGEDYLPSGLYYNTEPPEVIYLISSNHTAKNISYFSEHNVYLSNDGMYFAHFPTPFKDDRYTNSPPGTVLEFYANGNLVERYNVSQLVKNNSKLSYTESMVFWEKRGRHFNADNNTLSITTADDITYVFDITTGNIINGENTSVFTIVIVAVAALCALVIIFLVIRKRKYSARNNRD
jgi:hypothetical protein